MWKLLVLFILWNVCVFLAAYGAEWSYIAVCTAIIVIGGYVIIGIDKLRADLKNYKHPDK